MFEPRAVAADEEEKSGRGGAHESCFSRPGGRLADARAARAGEMCADLGTRLGHAYYS
jgi:hypothetical protein